MSFADCIHSKISHGSSSISIDMGWDENEFLQHLENPLFGENSSEDFAHMYERINERGIRPEDTLMLETPSNLLDATPGILRCAFFSCQESSFSLFAP